MNNIITEIYEKHIPLKIYKKLKPYYDLELLYDFEHEMILELYNIPTDKLKELYNNNELDNYFAKICLNKIVNPKSTFNKQYETKITKINVTEYENILAE